MKRTRPKSIAEVIDGFMKEEHLDTQLDEHRASALWPQIVGPGINRYTISRDVSGGVMRVRLSSAALRNQLMMGRTSLIQRINEALGHEVIHEIIFL
ncbi:MAG: DUF721 domain-containing protein [Muribaculaceae bacterium]|nr:DUF721 domain-containing protein [Muribaculaceae bacterium]